MFWFVTLLVILFLWAIAKIKLASPDLSRYDTPVGERFPSHDDDTEATTAVFHVIADVREQASATKSLKKGLAVARKFADNMSQDLVSDCEFQTVLANGVSCEWAVAPGADPKRRILFLHGGAFLMGSPKGHRIYAHNLSHMANAAVLSVDYQMMPETKRMQATLDAQSAYHWILSHGPDGNTPLDMLLVAGDSAGGNLALMLSIWSKTKAARTPDAVLGISPALDATLSAPSFNINKTSDHLLGKSLGFLANLPRALTLWFGVITMRANPSDPLLSPLLGELDNLPPTLIQASTSEVLMGDAVRYTNKATAAGSDVTLQLWEDQVHDWQIFTPNSGSGKQAWSEIEKFVAKF